MRPSDKKTSPEESKTEDQEEETKGEDIMEVQQNAPQVPAAAAAGTGSRSRRSSPERFNPHDAFPHNFFPDDPSMYAQNHHDGQADRHRFGGSMTSHGALDQMNYPLMPPAGPGVSNPFGPDPFHNPHGYHFSGLPSFDTNEDFGPPPNQHHYPYPPPQFQQYQQQQPPPNNNEAPSNNASAAYESMDDRKPAAVDTSRQQHYPEQGPNPRSYPTQDRNIKAPPYASLPSQDPPSEPSQHEHSRPQRRSTRAKRSSKAPPQGDSQQASASKRSSKKKPPVKKGSGTRAKPAHRNQVGTTVAIRLHPTERELEEARTPRKQQALRTWFERLRDLLEYKRRNGHTNVPQQYPPNHSLGIWVNKQRMEKKDMEAGKKSSMTREKVKLLEAAGFQWAKRKGIQAWEDKFHELQQYQQTHGHCNVPTKNRANRALGRWVSTQRSNYKKFKMGTGTLRPNTDEEETKRRILKLQSIGFQWSLLTRDSSSNEEGDSEETEEDAEEEEHAHDGPTFFDPPFDHHPPPGGGGGGGGPFPGPGMGGVSAAV